MMDLEATHIGLPLKSEPSLEATGVIWLKAWHVIFVVTRFAGLFYLPRPFV